MEISDLIGYAKELDLRAIDLMIKKNHDYADPGKEKDPLKIFKNLMMCEQMGICKTEIGIVVRLCDKFSRLFNILKEEHIIAIKTETLEDTVIDIQNYLKLLLAYRKAKEKNEETKI